MRVLRFSHDYLLNTGGMMVHLRCLNKELARAHGVEIDQAFLISREDEPLLISGGRVVRVGRSHFQSNAPVNLFPCYTPQRAPRRADMDSEVALKWFRRQFSALIRRRRPDVCHVHLVKHRVQLAAVELARAAGIPVVITHHEGLPESDEADQILQQASGLADFRCAISKHSAKAIRVRPVDYQGFFIDTTFWTESRIKPEEVERWRQQLQLSPSDLTILYPARYHPRKNHELLLAAAELLLDDPEIHSSGRNLKFVHCGESVGSNGPYRGKLADWFAHARWPGKVHLLEVLTRQELRALYSVADVVAYPALNEGSGRSHLEGMLLGCCAVLANDAGLVEHTESERSCLTFSPTSPADLAAQLKRLILFPDLRKSISHEGHVAASRLTLDRYAHDYFQLYETLASKRPAPAHAVQKRSPKGFGARLAKRTPLKDTLAECTLVIDLDQTLICPSRTLPSFPTPFPIDTIGEISIDAEAGRRYQIRAGLEELERIIRRPWRKRILLSYAPQAKICEVTKKLALGGTSAVDAFDACLGAEAINLFCKIHGLEPERTSDKALSNATGKPYRRKPLALALLDDVEGIGPRIAEGDLDGAAALLSRLPSPKVERRIVVADDKPYFDLTFLKPRHVAAFSVIPFGSLTNMAAYYGAEGNSAKAFDITDRVWLSGLSPFRFMSWALSQARSWSELLGMAGLEIEFIEGLARGENKEQRAWINSRAHATSTYRAFSDVCAPMVERARSLRLVEHVEVYRALALGDVQADLESGKAVLMLGRDMDYAYEVVRALLPGPVRDKRVALLPLSRAAAVNSTPESVLHWILDHLPCLTSDAVELVVYDVGFHGNIISRLAQIFASSPHLAHVKVSGKLLAAHADAEANHCSAVRFETAVGLRTVSREMTLSIERLPHAEGTVRMCRRVENGIVLERDTHSDEERQESQILKAEVNAMLAKPRRMRNGICPVLSLSHRASKVAVSILPGLSDILLKTVRPLNLLRNSPWAQRVTTVFHAFGGIDLITPLCVFPNLQRLVVIGAASNIPPAAQGPESYGEDLYVSNGLVLFARSPSPSLRDLYGTLRSSSDLGLADAALGSALCMLGVTHCGLFEGFISKPGTVASWEVSAGRRKTEVTHFDGSPHEPMPRIVQDLFCDLSASETAVLIKGGRGIWRKFLPHPSWNLLIQQPNVLIHDDTLGSLVKEQANVGLDLPPLRLSIRRNEFLNINPLSRSLSLRAVD